jgi:hypothetical protein
VRSNQKLKKLEHFKRRIDENKRRMPYDIVYMDVNHTGRWAGSPVPAEPVQLPLKAFPVVAHGTADQVRDGLPFDREEIFEAETLLSPVCSVSRTEVSRSNTSDSSPRVSTSITGARSARSPRDIVNQISWV